MSPSIGSPAWIIAPHRPGNGQSAGFLDISTTKSDSTPAGSVPSWRAGELDSGNGASYGWAVGEPRLAIVGDPAASDSARFPLSISGEALTRDVKIPSRCPTSGHPLPDLLPPPRTGENLVRIDQTRWLSLSGAASISSSIPKILSCVQLYVPLQRLAGKEAIFLTELIKGGWKQSVKGKK